MDCRGGHRRTAIGLSRWPHRVVRANLAFAAAGITIPVIWGIAWILPLPLGVAGRARR
jgi:hypothetical protein